MIIDISNLSQAKVLAVLYNAAGVYGIARRDYLGLTMTVEEAEEILIKDQEFDNFQTRPLKFAFSGVKLDVTEYDIYHGKGAAKEAINELRITGDVNSELVKTRHSERNNRGSLIM
ncbi:MAG: hypothetical protein KAI67_05965 [Candidatus Pacebacteria bacterium]|nr:hypothetical protein [Candidatus Paceibacterota bacterium]